MSLARQNNLASHLLFKTIAINTVSNLRTLGEKTPDKRTNTCNHHQKTYTNFIQLLVVGIIIKTYRRNSMKWETPTYKDLRFGFEVTMYIYNR
jgi:pyrroloquinoline quinone biosynthesis protein A